MWSCSLGVDSRVRVSRSELRSGVGVLSHFVSSGELSLNIRYLNEYRGQVQGRVSGPDTKSVIALCYGLVL